MKKYIIISLLLFIPSLAMAADHCTNPSEYTIDRRCYVTDEQKQQKPYNAVVGLVDNRGIYCTGTIVEEDGFLYVFTASHCVIPTSDSVAQNSINIILQNGVQMKPYCKYYEKGVDDKGIIDWALYGIDDTVTSLPIQSIPYVKKSKASVLTNDNFSIGYGSLKIMSDAGIRTFKEEYKKRLLNLIDKQENISQKIKDSKQAEIKKDNNDYGFTRDGGVSVWTQDMHLTDFGEIMYNLIKDFNIGNDNNNLKMSECLSGVCQRWHADSGGGVFDSSGNIVAIAVSGLDQIGGAKHAKSGANTIVSDRINFIKIRNIDKGCLKVENY